MVSQFTTSHAPVGTGQKGVPATSGAVEIRQHSATGSSEMPVLQPATLASQFTASQPVTAIKDQPLPTTSTAAATFQYQDSDFEQANLTSPVHPLEEDFGFSLVWDLNGFHKG